MFQTLILTLVQFVVRAHMQLTDPIIHNYTSVSDVCVHRCPDQSLSEHHAHYVHGQDLQAGDLN